MISNLIQFFKFRIWEIKLKDLHPLKAFLIRVLRIILLAYQGFIRNRGQKTASVLTYYSMLNIVPVVAVAFAVAKGFGLEKMIEKQILQMAAKANWQADMTNQIIAFSQKFLERAKGGLIAGIGVVLLFWAVISILGKIEESLNHIWEIKQSRTIVRKFSDYIALIVLTPILLIISSSATVLVTSQVKIIFSKIALLGIFSNVVLFLLNLLPYVSIWALLTMLYLIMPNTRIPFRSALIGGVTAGTIAQIVQWLYFTLQIGVTKYGAIYGSFSALPLFLGLLQISWMIVLFGAEVAHANEHYETFGFHPDYSKISLSSKKFLMLRIFHLLTKRFTLGEKSLSAKQIAYTLEIPLRLVRQILHELIDVGLVAETIKGIKGEVAYQPGRTIENITVKHALDEYEKCGITKVPFHPSEEAEKISKSLQDLSETIEKSPANIRLKEI